MELPSVKIFHSTSLKQKQVPIGYLFLIKPERIKIKSVFEYRLFNIMTFVRSIDVDVLGSLSSCFQFLRINFLWGKIKKINGDVYRYDLNMFIEISINPQIKWLS